MSLALNADHCLALTVRYPAGTGTTTMFARCLSSQMAGFLLWRIAAVSAMMTSYDSLAYDARRTDQIIDAASGRHCGY